MATETVSAPSVEAFTREHTNALYDAAALLEAAADRLDAAMPARVDDQDAAESGHNTIRLVHMARAKVKAVADLMFDHT